MLIKVNTGPTLMFFLGGTGLGPSCTVSKIGGAFASSTNSPAEVGNGWYSLLLNTSETDTPGELCFHFSAGTFTDFQSQVVAVFFGDILDANVVDYLGGAAPALVGGNLPASVQAMANNVLTNNAIASSAVTRIFSGVTLTEAYPTLANDATPAQLLYAILQALTAFDINLAGDLLTVRKLNGATPAMTYDLSPAGDPTGRARAT